MAGKGKKLPDDFPLILESGDLARMQAVFDDCALDATRGYSQETALHHRNCPPELVAWLVEQGLDVNTADRHGATALATAARHGDLPRVRALLDAGADVAAGEQSPLIAASSRMHLDVIRLLLDNGADPNATRKLESHPALTVALMCDYDHLLPAMPAVVDTLLGAGAEVNDRARLELRERAKDADKGRARKSPEVAAEHDASIEELHRLLDQDRAEPLVPHDGKSRITVRAEHWKQQYNELFDTLVPDHGPALSLQGEIIRIAGRISNEILNNGSINWDDDFRLMLQFWFRTIMMEQESVEALRDGAIDEEAVDRIRWGSVQWVLSYPDPVPLGDVTYRR